MGVLPTEKRNVVLDVRYLNTLLYGQPGIGKSTLASHSDGAIFFATEDGLKSLEVFEHKCGSWADVEAGVEELRSMSRKKDRPFRTVVIDTIDNLALFAALKVIEDAGGKIEHEGDLGHGKGYGLVNRKLKDVLSSIAGMRTPQGLPAYGLWLISHRKEIELEDQGRKWTKVVPSLSGSISNIVQGFTDLILFYDVRYDETKGHVRVLRTNPTRYHVAKDRTGRLPEEIECPDPATGFATLVEMIGISEEPPKSSPLKSPQKSPPKSEPKETAPKESPPKETPSNGLSEEEIAKRKEQFRALSKELKEWWKAAGESILSAGYDEVEMRKVLGEILTAISSGKLTEWVPENASKLSGDERAKAGVLIDEVYSARVQDKSFEPDVAKLLVALGRESEASYILALREDPPVDEDEIEGPF